MQNRMKDKILKDIFIKEDRRYSSLGTKLIEFIKNYPHLKNKINLK